MTTAQEPMTRQDVALRGWLTVIAAMIQAATTSAALWADLPAWVPALVGVIGMGATTWRGWLDKSSSQAGQTAPPTVTAVTTGTLSTVVTSELETPAPLQEQEGGGNSNG